MRGMGRQAGGLFACGRARRGEPVVKSGESWISLRFIVNNLFGGEDRRDGGNIRVIVIGLLTKLSQELLGLTVSWRDVKGM